MVILLTMTIVNMMVMQHCIGEVEIDLSWWRERHIFHFSQKGSVVVMVRIYLWEFLRKFLRKKERTKGHRHVEHGGDAQGDLLPRLGWNEEDEPGRYFF